jgi:hypothetical protein
LTSKIPGYYVQPPPEDIYRFSFLDPYERVIRYLDEFMEREW